MRTNPLARAHTHTPTHTHTHLQTNTFTHFVSRAVIKLTLVNEGELAYQPEKFGKLIIVERIIHKTQAGAVNLLDENGKKRESGRDALRRLMDHLDIQVDNPMQILSQGVSSLCVSSLLPLFNPLCGVVSVGAPSWTRTGRKERVKWMRCAG